MKWLRELCRLHKSDRQSLTVLLLLGIMALIILHLTDSDRTPESLPDIQNDSTEQVDTPAHSATYYYIEEQKPQRFVFDPNTADSTQLLRLGLQPWQVRSIYKYRARGGIYRKKEDFARLYGLTVKQYRELEPYIQIGQDYLPASTLLKSESSSADSTAQHYKIAEGEQVVLNMADTTALLTVPGIGPYFARQIVRYGQRLGGYVSIDQLDEIEDFPTGSKRYFRIEAPQPRQLDVNSLTLNELKRHPYINYYQAKAITDYRRQHGLLRSLDDLRFNRDFPPEAIERLRPYVSFQTR